MYEKRVRNVIRISAGLCNQGHEALHKPQITGNGIQVNFQTTPIRQMVSERQRELAFDVFNTFSRYGRSFRAPSSIEL